ncbi:hypothetical protein GCM10007939_19950 [Amylibacter marinus]|uniref:YdhG-like domain-containing protein n=1 Tax=Amylibacter marinus TaxID=1475483 RepID=A0ABQ5VWA5_9RHOB|nr:DUF1801 domain-containing protein [Amylibacter marinus]GLQ35712.1 hypothetical protein GCM10007939_19950 [Amylibacter marinus]
MQPPFTDDEIRKSFDALPADALELRALIYRTADDIGDVTENLRWGQPSYSTPQATPLRIGAPKTGGFALYAHCQSSVIPTFAQTFGAEFDIQGTRAVHFQSAADLQPEKLRLLIRHALTYRA